MSNTTTAARGKAYGKRHDLHTMTGGLGAFLGGLGGSNQAEGFVQAGTFNWQTNAGQNAYYAGMSDWVMRVGIDQQMTGADQQYIQGLINAADQAAMQATSAPAPYQAPAPVPVYAAQPAYSPAPAPAPINAPAPAPVFVPGNPAAPAPAPAPQAYTPTYTPAPAPLPSGPTQAQIDAANAAALKATQAAAAAAQALAAAQAAQAAGASAAQQQAALIAAANAANAATLAAQKAHDAAVTQEQRDSALAAINAALQGAGSAQDLTGGGSPGGAGGSLWESFTGGATGTIPATGESSGIQPWMIGVVLVGGALLLRKKKH